MEVPSGPEVFCLNIGDTVLDGDFAFNNEVDDQPTLDQQDLFWSDDD